jgi:hypothetical protein
LFLTIIANIAGKGLDHMANALLFQDSLDTFDGVALAIEQMADAAQQLDIIGAVVSAPTASLHWFDL